MSEEIANPLGALNIELQGQDFTPVLIPPGQQMVQITSAGVHTSKAGKQSLKITAATVMDIPSTVAGSTVPSGTELELYLGLQVDPTLEGQRLKDALRRMKDKLQTTVRAAFNTSVEDCPNLDDQTLNQMVGKQVVAMIDIESDPIYGDRNRLQGFIPQVG